MGKLTPDEQNNFNARIQNWSSKSPFGQRVTRNIYLEHFMQDDKLEDLFRFIANDISTSSKVFEVNYVKKCRALKLQGGNIKTATRPKLFGAAVEYETFLKHLIDNYPTELGYAGDNTIVKDFILRLNKGMISSGLGTAIRFKQFLVWSTWNKNDLNGMPFDYAIADIANEIRANMGLSREDATTSTGLLLFVYTIPSHIELKRPTIADAELYQYFAPPPPPVEEHGLTETWQHEPWMNTCNIEPRPECIHDSIYLSDLKLPVELKL